MPSVAHHVPRRALRRPSPGGLRRLGPGGHQVSDLHSVPAPGGTPPNASRELTSPSQLFRSNNCNAGGPGVPPRIPVARTPVRPRRQHHGRLHRHSPPTSRDSGDAIDRFVVTSRPPPPGPLSSTPHRTTCLRSSSALGPLLSLELSAISTCHAATSESCAQSTPTPCEPHETVSPLGTLYPLLPLFPSGGRTDTAAGLSTRILASP